MVSHQEEQQWKTLCNHLIASRERQDEATNAFLPIAKGNTPSHVQWEEERQTWGWLCTSSRRLGETGMSKGTGGFGAGMTRQNRWMFLLLLKFVLFLSFIPICDMKLAWNPIFEIKLIIAFMCLLILKLLPDTCLLDTTTTFHCHYNLAPHNCVYLYVAEISSIHSWQCCRKLQKRIKLWREMFGFSLNLHPAVKCCQEIETVIETNPPNNASKNFHGYYNSKTRYIISIFGYSQLFAWAMAITLRLIISVIGLPRLMD